jgi:phage shock protein C
MDTRRITRSRSDRMVAGVAAGLAARFGIDPVIVRIGFVVLGLMNGFGLLVYLALWLIVPNEDSLGGGRSTVHEAIGEMQAYGESVVAQIRGAFQR